MDSSIPHRLAVAALWLAACSSNGTPESARPQSPAGAGVQGGAGGTASGLGGGGTASGLGAAGGTSDPGAETAAPYRTSSRALVQWKRAAALEADLMGALQLTREQLCVELGGKSCIREVHLVPMGGNEPYESGLMKPSAEPLATTPSVVDRVLLSACSTRARLDGEGAPQVFTALALNGPLPPADDPAIATTIRDLYRRLLARDPTPRELELVAGLAEGDGALSTRDFAALSCFTIGSSAEFLFF
jgi:hypothetical protein